MLSCVLPGYLLGAGDMARSEARILLIGSDLGQGLSSVGPCVGIYMRPLSVVSPGPGRRGTCVYSCLRMINEHDLTRRDYTDA